MVRRSLCSALLLLAFVLWTSSAFALMSGTYKLSNHPDGNAADPEYGLRLDGLVDGDTNSIYTFDFDHASSDMKLYWNGIDTVIIQGQAFGGKDIGSVYDGATTAVWDISFTYKVGVSTPGGDGGVEDVVVVADNQNFGTISSIFGDFDLRDKSNGSYSFQLGDEDGTGHRRNDGALSGWGWLNHCPVGKPSVCDTHLAASDWLFTADRIGDGTTPIPVPAAAWLFGTGLAGLVGVARRRRSRNAASA